MIIMNTKKIKKSSVILTACAIAFFCDILVAEQTTSQNRDVSTIMLKEQVERQEKLLSADFIVKKAYQAYIDKKYDIAHDNYLKGIKLLESISSQKKDIKIKVAKLKDALALVYTYWAQDILHKSEIATGSKKYDEAIKLCRMAAEIDPTLTSDCDKIIANIKKKRAYSNYRFKISDRDAEMNLKKRVYNTDVLYAQGKKLYFDKKYTEAKEKLEGVLVLDPYNAKAIQYLKLTNDKIALAGLNRSEITYIKMQAEAEWENLSPIIAKTLSGERVDIAEVDEPILKLTDNESIKKKLDDIMISHIAFEEVPIITAMLFLKSESKRLDPEGKGINIFLKLESKNEVDENIDEENADDVGDDEWEDEDFEDSSDGDEKMDDFADQYLVTIVLNNVPLGTVIDYLCRATGLKHRISKYAVEVYTPGTGFDEMEIKVIPMEKDLFEHLLLKENTSAASDMKDYFKERGILFPDGATAVYDTKISRLILRNTPEQISNIIDLITKLNTDVPQVSVFAKFVEMEQKDFEELGFEWRLSQTDAKQATNPNITFDENDQLNRFALINDQQTSDPNNLDRAFGAFVEKAGIRLDSVIHALDKNEQIEVLSSPRVTTMSGQEATIKMVTYTYYPVSWTEPNETTQTSTGAGTSYYIPSTPVFEEPTPVGIFLSVIPTVRADKYTIDLEMEPQVQTFDGWTDYSYDSDWVTDKDSKEKVPNVIKMPIFNIRTIKTHLNVYDGDTVVMGGVVRDNTNSVDDRIPIMGDVPLIGRFFRSEVEDVNKTNLLIFVKVKLVDLYGVPIRSEYKEGLPPFN